MKKLILVGLLLATSQMAVAAKWLLLREAPEELKAYIDVDSINHLNQNGYMSAWSKYIWSTQQKASNNQLYNEAKALFYYDCNHKKFALVQYIAYSKQESNVVDTQNIPSIDKNSSDNWNDITPDTIGNVYYRAVCQFHISQ